ncbi:hypothetical protein L211DRAFT_852585 [Terfezia boudieri ATCC MYA-4762]|uniref:DUF6532 domain-containing protein n=1 Tax=Terfezia boudieri ATCC MYA-4762 TaxID=1051890 RepID=A0A3N4LBC0_9PEZI|nr:hypothetical protein L211DRAFT_852585 [Terfezia boudieri ATCC MYA-4762]
MGRAPPNESQVSSPPTTAWSQSSGGRINSASDTIDEPLSSRVDSTRVFAENHEGIQSPKPRMKGAKQRAPRNRSFTQFDGITKAVVTIAAKRIERVTFFENPLPDTEGTESMLAAAWKAAEVECAVDEERTSKIDSYLRSIQSWTRSHLVYEAKRHIARLYGFDQNCSPEYIRKHVSWLLDKDRFTCQREKRVGWGQRFRASEAVDFIHMNYFDGPKKLGNRDPEFMSRISSPFMCLIFATLQHALQTYETGMFKDGEFFNYEKAGVDFNRMLDQWNLLTTTMEQTLLKIIRLEIAKLCELHGKVVRWQRAEAYGVGPRELAQYAEELAADLKEAEKGTLIPPGYFNEGSPTEPDESAIPDNISTGLPTMLDDGDDEDDEPEGELGDNDEDNHEVPAENDDGEQSGDSDGDEVQEELVSDDGEDEEDEL